MIYTITSWDKNLRPPFPKMHILLKKIFNDVIPRIAALRRMHI